MLIKYPQAFPQFVKKLCGIKKSLPLPREKNFKRQANYCQKLVRGWNLFVKKRSITP